MDAHYIDPFPRYEYVEPEITTPDIEPEHGRANTSQKVAAITLAPVYGENETETPWLFGKVQDTVLLPMILTLLAIWCLLGNMLVVYSIITHRHMRTGFNFMLLNISASDLVFVLLTVPTAIINHASADTMSQLPGLQLCKFVHYVTFVTVYVAVYTIVVLCVFRFCGEYMSDNGKSVSYLSRGNSVLSCFVIWVAFMMSHLNFLLQPEVAIFQEPFICLHSDALMDPTKLRTLWITFLSCGFMLPVTAICILSVLTLRKYDVQDGGRLRMRRPGYYESNSNLVSHSTSDSTHPERKKTTLLMTIMLARIACWLPIQIFVMVDIFGYSQSNNFYRKVEMLSVCIAFVASCINPLIYHALYFDMKNAFKETLVRLGCGSCITLGPEDENSDMNETIMSIISDSSNHINYQPA